MDLQKKSRNENQAKWVTLCCLLFSSVFFLRGPVRNDDQPPMQHLAPIFPIYSAIPLVPHDFFHIFTHPFCDVASAWCLIRLRSSTPSFPMHFPLYHTLFHSSHPPSLIMWPKKESLRRTIPSCLVVFSSVKILWSVRCSQSN